MIVVNGIPIFLARCLTHRRRVGTRGRPDLNSYLCVGHVVRTSSFEPSSGIFVRRVVVGSLRVPGRECWVTFYSSLGLWVGSILKILLRG